MRTEADGFMGAILASQSVKGLKAMINGPGGCRSRAMNLLREMIIEYRGDEGCCCKSRYMSRVTMLPCTHLNADDIILGSGAKITDGLKSVISGTGSDVVLIDTLGATVQVVDREDAVKKSGYADKVILASEDLSAMTYTEGFDDTMVCILEHYVKEAKTKRPRSVNILGYTQADRSWDYGKRELTLLFSLMGVEVVTFVGCDCSVEDLEASTSAELNVVIHPEYCINTARWYKQRFGTEYLIPSDGTPVGYDSIRSFMHDVASMMGLDVTSAIAYVDAEERAVCRVIKNYDKFANGLRGSSMALEGLASDVLPMCRLMYDYFNMAPRSVNLVGTNRCIDDDRVRNYLDAVGHPEALGAPVPESNLKLLMCDGYKAMEKAQNDNTVACIGIAIPFPDTVPLTDRCLIGLSGTRNLLDQLLNNVKKFTCGQPTPADFR